MPLPFPPLSVRTGLGAAALALTLSGAGVAQDAAMTMEEVEQAYLSGDRASAREGILTFAEAGDATAQYRLGFMLATGEGGPFDRQGAIDWLEKAVAQDHGAAALLLARVYLSGSPEEPDYIRAGELLQAIAGPDVPEAAYLLAQLLQTGRAGEADPVRGFELMQIAAEAGHLGAQFGLARLYANGTGVAQDDAQAMRWLFQSADAGWAPAQMTLYEGYNSGDGFPQDQAKALEWLRKAAEAGYGAAEHVLGSNYLLGEGGVEEDALRGVAYLVRAAEKGIAEAQSNLGYAYYTGKGVGQDDVKALEWFREAADQGLARAAAAAAQMYEAGRGAEADVERAVWYFRIADAGGNPYAGARLGRLIVSGDYTAEDQPELAPSWVAQAADAGAEGAVDWLDARASEGDDMAHYLLAALYHESETVGTDPEKAVRHMRIAAEAGIVPAQLSMGLFYSEGYGVEQDLVQAHVWTNIAAANGSDAAAEKRDAFAALMTPDEIAKAQEDAASWLDDDR
ncbi:tetratricopeptide repeat protein [Psychromarinibacter sp. S121]|uniref:tetratricopeptide repeat protein n=1 Tax=Psychromarinibacter sp. S121 TaxID=3415127 RepID=UPI003C7D51CE